MKKTKDIFMYALGGLIVAGIFALLALLILVAMPEPNKDILQIVIGALVASFSMVVSYLYGSSKGSADKNEAIEKKLNNEAPGK